MTFEGKRFEIFREHVSCNLLCRRLIDSVELSSTVRSFLSRYHGYHIFVHLFRVFRHSRPPLLRESNIFAIYFTETSVSSINLIERMYLHLPNLCFLNEQLQTRQLKGSLFTRTICLRGGGGVPPEKIGWGMRPAFQNPYPIYDQTKNSKPYL